MSNKVKLKVLWLKDFLGLGIDQIMGEQKYPLTPYYFWPRTDAWEQLKSELDSKPWLENKSKIKILNLTVDIMNHLGEYRNTESIENVKKGFFDVDFFDLEN